MEKERLLYILEKAQQGLPPDFDEARELLLTGNPEDILLIQETAQIIREKYFDHRIFLYGFIYFSTFCRNQCTFCFYRRQNRISARYRKNVEEVIDISHELRESGVHLIDLTMGEDPAVHDKGDYSYLYRIIEGIRSETDLPLMISPGVIPDEVLCDLADLGTDWYALYQESHNPLIYRRLRQEQGFEERVRKRSFAMQLGMLVEDGILIGVGETEEDRAESFTAMQRSGINQARVMSFVPQPGTPLSSMKAPSRNQECLAISVMRLMMPDRLIPASLDVDGIDGLQMRINAGANVVTSIIPPKEALAGVSNPFLDIEEGFRSAKEVRKVIQGMGLEIADAEDYSEWIRRGKSEIGKEKVQACGLR